MPLSAILWALPWILLAVGAPFLFPLRPRLRDHALGPSGPAPLVSVIVPARNEALNIGACVGSLLHSSYANLEVVIVDDNSTDGTGDIARNLAEGNQRVRLVEGEPLPDGWLGKCWACWQGYRRARGELLLFTDADTRHERDLIGHAVAALLDSGASLVSVIPRMDMETFWERVVLPHVFVLLAMRYPDLRRVNRSTNPRDAIANGQFLLFRRDGYEAVGGHEAVRDEVVEDLRLAQRTRAARRSLYLAHAQDLMRTRMYRSFREIVEGWSKNLATGARQSVDAWLRPFLPWIMGLAVGLFWLAPALAFAAGMFDLAGPALFGWGLLSSAAALAFWLGAMVRFRAPLPYAFAFPLGGAMTGFLVLRSASRGPTVSWKGRTYRTGPGSGVSGHGRNST